MPHTVLSPVPKFIHFIFINLKIGMMFIFKIRKREPLRGGVTCVVAL